MYPEGYQTAVRVDKLTQHLCGITRPTHFEGVTTVVTKLFNATKPHVAVFGEKDFQQLQVIRRMVRDLDVDIEIIGAPIVREPDGLAMSSRNKYLAAEERRAALILSQTLFNVRQLCAEGERDALKLSRHVWQKISTEPLAHIDYIKICDLETLEDVVQLKRDAVVALAVFFGKTRLIDNIAVKQTDAHGLLPVQPRHACALLEHFSKYCSLHKNHLPITMALSVRPEPVEGRLSVHGSTSSPRTALPCSRMRLQNKELCSGSRTSGAL